MPREKSDFWLLFIVLAGLALWTAGHTASRIHDHHHLHQIQDQIDYLVGETSEVSP